jgi:hypothetical protein
MGSSTSSHVHPPELRTRFAVDLKESTCCLHADFPADNEFQQRVSCREWNDFVQAIAKKYVFYMKIFLGCFICFFGIIFLSAFVSRWFFLGLIVAVPGIFSALTTKEAQMTKVTIHFNEALFRPRRVVVSRSRCDRITAQQV